MKNDYTLARDLTPESRRQIAESNTPMVEVESSQIHSVGYWANKQILFIRFISTDTCYCYLEVPPEVYQAFLAAESKGKFMNAEIRNKFVYARL